MAEKARVIPFPEGSAPATGTRRYKVPAPTFTKSDAVKAGLCDRETYERTQPYHAMTVRYHLAAGTPRSEWEPPTSVGYSLSQPYVDHAAQELNDLLKCEVDALLEDHDALLRVADFYLDRLERLPGEIAGSEPGTTYSGSEAVRRARELGARIEGDRAVGHGHHDRAPRWLTTLARWTPGLGAAGFVAYLAMFLPVGFWASLASWGYLAVVLPYLILGQTWLVDRAARAHADLLAAEAEGQPGPAEAARNRRFRFGTIAGLGALGVTSGIVLRAVEASASVTVGGVALMVLLAIVVGVAMPGLRYLGTVSDGSKASRERDALVAGLEADHAAYEDLVAQVERNLRGAEDIDRRLIGKTVPETIDHVQRVADQAIAPYAFLRLQIGGLGGEPPLETPASDSTRIGTGIPGAPSVSLQPLLDRARRREQLRVYGATLAARLRTLPAHPWSTTEAKRG